MAESRIDIGHDLSALLTEDFDIESAIDFDDLLRTPKNQDFYDLTSKTMPVSDSTHNLKTVNTLYRTQLKLQLMRDHAILEHKSQERAPKKQFPNSKTAPLPLKVPLHNLTDIPAQVLQVQTKQDNPNPTKYQVMEKQTTQVKQYLSESYQTAGNSDLTGNYRTNLTHSVTPTGIGTPNLVPNTVSSNVSQSQPYPYTQENPSPNYDIPVLSPTLSSGATSTSEVSIIYLYTY